MPVTDGAPGACYSRIFWTNATHTEPMMAALMAGEFAAAHLKDGDVDSVRSRFGYPKRAGASSRTPLSGPVSLVVAEAQ